MLRGFWMLSWCAGVALVPHGEARAEGPVEPAAQAPEIAGSRAPAVEVSTAKRVRHDVYFGMGFGFGGGNAGASGAGLAATGWLRVGGRLREKVGLGGALMSSIGGTGDGGGAGGFTNVMAEALFFPIKKRGLGLSVGLGFSSAWGMRGQLTAGERRSGAGLSLGLGYDFWLARRFNLGLWLRGDASAGRYGLASVGTFGLGFSWY